MTLRISIALLSLAPIAYLALDVWRAGRRRDDAWASAKVAALIRSASEVTA